MSRAPTRVTARSRSRALACSASAAAAAAAGDDLRGTSRTSALDASLRATCRVDPRSCRTDGVPATFARSDFTPDRLPFGEHFDLAFALSVVTHLSEAAHERCLLALRGSLKPGGILVVTIRLAAFLDICESRGLLQEPLNRSSARDGGGGRITLLRAGASACIPLARTESSRRECVGRHAGTVSHGLALGTPHAEGIETATVSRPWALTSRGLSSDRPPLLNFGQDDLR